MEVLEKKVSTKVKKKDTTIAKVVASETPLSVPEQVITYSGNEGAHIDNPKKVEEVIVEKVPQNIVTGTIVGCNLLRLREGANIRTKELVQIPVDSVVCINLENSTESFYEVTYKTNNQVLIGFCVKDFIKLG